MLPKNLSEKVKTIIEINPEISVIHGAYFNPMFTNKLKEKIPELQEAGFNLTQTITEDSEGELVQAAVTTSNGMSLDLGSLLLDGKDLKVEKPLATLDTLVSFIRDNAMQTL